jgi:hypothetical protein
VPRLVTWAEMVHTPSNTPFFFATTHFDNNAPCQVSSESRGKGAARGKGEEEVEGMKGLVPLELNKTSIQKKKCQ